MTFERTMQIASRLIELGGFFVFLCATSEFSVSLWLMIVCYH